MSCWQPWSSGVSEGRRTRSIVRSRISDISRNRDLEKSTTPSFPRKRESSFFFYCFSHTEQHKKQELDSRLRGNDEQELLSGKQFGEQLIREAQAHLAVAHDHRAAHQRGI